MSTVIDLALFAFLAYFMFRERRRWNDLIEEDRRREEEHVARMEAIREGVILVGRRTGLRGMTALYQILPAESWLDPEPEPVPKMKKRNPRPNRRRKAQRLRAARQRKSWHQVLVRHEDEDAG